MYAVIWLIQYLEPSTLHRDRLHQLLEESGISEAVQRNNAFVQWLAPSPDPEYDARNPFFHTPGSRGAEIDGRTTHRLNEGTDELTNLLYLRIDSAARLPTSPQAPSRRAARRPLRQRRTPLVSTGGTANATTDAAAGSDVRMNDQMRDAHADQAADQREGAQGGTTDHQAQEANDTTVHAATADTTEIPGALGRADRVHQVRGATTVTLAAATEADAPGPAPDTRSHEDAQDQTGDPSTTRQTVTSAPTEGDVTRHQAPGVEGNERQNDLAI